MRLPKVPIPRIKRKSASLKAGLPPGSLVYTGSRPTDAEVVVERIDFSPDGFSEQKVADVSDLADAFSNDTVTWINVFGIHRTEIISDIGKVFNIHPLVLEDILNTQHRPKVEAFDDFVFFTMKTIEINAKQHLEVEQLSIIFHPKAILVLQEKQGDAFNPIRKRLRENTGVIRKKTADYLLYRLIDSVVDNYAVVLEQLEDNIDELEQELYLDVDKDHTRPILFLKRQTVQLKRLLLPLLEAVSGWEKGTTGMVLQENEKFFHDLYDHLAQLSDNLEMNLEILTGLMDLHFANMSMRMNNVMKVLTVIATIFIPLTFIAGIYGMNFDHMPELHFKYGYYVVWGIMILVFIGMLIFFRRKKWF